MTRMSKLLFAATASLAITGSPVFAQGEEDAEPSGDEAPVEDPGGDPADPQPAVETGGAGIAGWPQQIIIRPLTLNAGMLRVQGDLGILRFSLFEPITMTTASGTGVGLTAGAGYGVSDKIEVGGSYGISLKDFEAKGPLTVYGAYRLMDGKMRAAARASFTYNLASETAGLGVGVDFWYNLSDKLTVFSPGNQLQIGIDPSGASIELPVAVGFQANDNIFAFLQTSLATIGIDPSGSAFLFADRTPITVGAFYSPSNKMDIGAAFGTVNVGDIADIFTLTLTARLFM